MHSNDYKFKPFIHLKYNEVFGNISYLAKYRLIPTIAVPPRFVITPSDHQVHRHGSVNLQCAARGDPPPHIRWFRNSAPIVLSHRTFISEEGDLAIYNITFTDEGLYECIAENIAGIVRSYARVTVFGKFLFMI